VNNIAKLAVLITLLAHKDSYSLAHKEQPISHSMASKAQAELGIIHAWLKKSQQIQKSCSSSQYRFEAESIRQQTNDIVSRCVKKHFIRSWSDLERHLTKEEQGFIELFLQLDCEAVKDILKKNNIDKLFDSLWKYRFNQIFWDHLSGNEVALIRILDLSGQGLKRMPRILRRTPFLYQLNMDNNDLLSVEDFPVLENLQGLGLNGNKIRSLEHFPSLPNLRLLGLCKNLISRLCLSTQPTLEQLFVDDNTIERLDGFSVQPRLEILSLNGNHITEIQAFPQLDNLITLGLDKNRLTKIQLPQLKKLERLSINSNNIKTLVPLGEQPKLMYLFASHNKITSLEGASQFRKLQKLFLDDNNITSIASLMYLPDLKVLCVKYNPITTWSDLPLPTRLTFYPGICIRATPNTAEQKKAFRDFLCSFRKAKCKPVEQIS
jgi:hypothetical protein